MRILATERQTAGYDVELARKLGLNPAIILSRIIWSVECHMQDPSPKNKRFFIEDNWYMYESYTAFQQYSGLSRYQVTEAIKYLEKLELIFIRQFGFNRSKWYAINTQKLAEFLSNNIKKPDKRRSNKVPAKTTIVEKLDHGDKTPSSRNSMIKKLDHASSRNSIMEDRETRSCIVEKLDGVTNTLSDNPSKNPEEGGTRARACKEGNPPTIHKFSDQLKTESETGTGNPPPELKKAPPVDVVALGDQWFDWVTEMLVDHGFKRSEFHDGVAEIVERLKGDVLKASWVLEVIKNDPEHRRRFRSPKFHRRTFGDMTLLEDALLKIRPDRANRIETKADWERYMAAKKAGLK